MCGIGVHGHLGGRRASSLLTEVATRVDKPKGWETFFEITLPPSFSLAEPPEGELLNLSTYDGMLTDKLNKMFG
jgi:hypothetical protein